AADRDHVGGDDGLVRRLALIAARPAVHGARVEQHAAVVADRRELDDAGDLRLILEQELLRRGGEEPFAPALTGALRIRSAGKEPFGAMIHEGGPARPATARIRSTGSAHAGASGASGAGAPGAGPARATSARASRAGSAGAGASGAAAPRSAGPAAPAGAAAARCDAAAAPRSGRASTPGSAARPARACGRST